MIRSELFAGGGERVGLELELFPVLAGPEDGDIALVPLRSEGVDAGPAIIPLLEKFARQCGGRMMVECDGAPCVTTPGGGTITLEPAGQIEYSGPPLDGVSEALADLRDAVRDLTMIGADMGIDFLACGYNSLVPEDSIELRIAKPRYIAMDRHFCAIGPYGRRMMRATCALQINLDFGHGAVAAERWRLANMIAPSLNAIFANSPHTHEGRRYGSFRYEIWRHADPARTGRLYDRPDLDPIADYLRFALDASVMLVTDDEGRLGMPSAPMTFRQWLGGSRRHGFPDQEDWCRHLTTLFPDVRARGWMELRSIDSLPPDLWDVPVAMVTTLLYDDDVRHAALERLEFRSRLREPGSFEHDGFRRADYRTGAELLELVLPFITDPVLAAACRRYHEDYTSRERTPGDVRPGVRCSTRSHFIRR